MKPSVVAALAGLLCAIPACTIPAAAQDWPTKPVKFIVPFAAGATPDVVARLITDYLQDKTGQTFIVENKPGASGNIGTETVAKADADGATIGVSIGGPLAINTLLFDNLPYDPRKDLSLITLLVTQPSVLAVNAGLGVNTTRDLIDLIKRNPGKYTFGSIGTGSLSHLAMEAIALKSGTELVHVPYPVSYTHLDVYKRQLGIFEAGSIDHFEIEVAEVRITFSPITRHARLIVDQREPPTDEPVE